MLWRLIKLLLVLIILGGIALIVYAYAGPIFFPGDFAAPSETITVPYTLDAN